MSRTTVGGSPHRHRSSIRSGSRSSFCLWLLSTGWHVLRDYHMTRETKTGWSSSENSAGLYCPAEEAKDGTPANEPVVRVGGISTADGVRK